MIGEPAAVLASPVKQHPQAIGIIDLAAPGSPANIGKQIQARLGGGIRQPVGRR